jgi:hypothetical protein
LAGMVTDHDTAKLFPRPGAAIKFHLRRSSTIAKRFEGTKGRQP